MTSTSNKVEEDGDPVSGQILDAARESVLAVGVRRTTATDVARTAGISRMTLYRRFPDVRRVLAALLTREFAALLDDVRLQLQGAQSGRKTLCAMAIGVVRSLAADPLFARVLDVDPEVLLPYVITRTGASQRNILAALRLGIEQGHADGSIRAGDPELMARSVLLTVQSFVLSA
ncbi:MAG: TetR/AcrR family transcriptional regulator, partial [Mycobacteriaceae bacterium]